MSFAPDGDKEICTLSDQTESPPTSFEPPRKNTTMKEIEKLAANRNRRRLQAEATMVWHAINDERLFRSMIKKYQDELEIIPLEYAEPVKEHQVKVCIRKRPMSDKDMKCKDWDVVTMSYKSKITVHALKERMVSSKYPELENRNFCFDCAFDDSCNNATVYRYTAGPLVQTVLDGGMATCFTYGETGSGKTYTMIGESQDCREGVFAMTADEIFLLSKSQMYCHYKLSIACSFFEIYKDKVFDLLTQGKKLRLVEDPTNVFQIAGLTERVANSFEDLLKLIQLGNAERTYYQTIESNSSASHAVFQIVLRSPNNNIHGKFSLIDLAGNRKASSSAKQPGVQVRDWADINNSYLALKECIRALSRGDAHVPFRRSKITQVLRDSFIGENSTICMIATLNPGLSSRRHSLNTLQYSNVAKTLQLKNRRQDFQCISDAEVTYNWKTLLSLIVFIFGTLLATSFAWLKDQD